MIRSTDKPLSVSSEAIAKSGRGRRLAVLFRIAAVLLALLPFVVIESVLALFGLGEPTYRDDPFVGFKAVHPLFVPSADGIRYEIVASRHAFFRPDSFPAAKGPREFRMFFLGGSTVQGSPFSTETAFSTFLEISLRQADPSRDWNAINCGGISYASYRLVPILEEVLRYQPDLIVLCTGHNEFLEDRSYRHIKRLPGVLAWPARVVMKSRTYTLLHEGYLAARGRAKTPAPQGRPILEDETDAMLEYRGGLDQYHRDDKWRADVVEHYEYNVRRMVALAKEARVPLILMNPVANLRDCPPFKAEHRAGLADAELAHWKSLVARASEHHDSDLDQSIALLEEAMEIDDQHAGLHFLLAKVYDSRGRLDDALREYLLAKELDVCPLRIIEPMNRAILTIAKETGTPLVDVWAAYEQVSPDGIPGDYLLVDHVHPSVAGHQMIADMLTEAMIELAFARRAADWRKKKDEAYKAHVASLDNLYFEKGMARLDVLRCWARGMSNTERLGRPEHEDWDDHKRSLGEN